MIEATIETEEHAIPPVADSTPPLIDGNDLEALLEENLGGLCMKPGSLIVGVVSEVADEAVSVYVGLKSEGLIPKAEFLDEEGECTVKKGDEVEVALEYVEDGNGLTILSREKARRLSAWAKMETAFQSGATVTGYLRSRVKGGFSVEIGNVRAFLPGSLVDIQPVYDASDLENKPLDMRIIKLDQERNNVVVSRRAVLLESLHKDKDSLLARIEKGQILEGLVKNLTTYGAFVDLGGVDGLLHNTDISWRRVNHPSEVINVGDKIQVQVLDFDKEQLRISLGLKQLADDPWKSASEKFPLQSQHKGKVTGVREYGCFVSLDSGVEGLVHASEMDWMNRKVIPSNIVSIGDEVDVMVLEIDDDRRRISLGIKQCKANPWDAFKEKYAPGAKVKGKIRDLTEFGIFVSLEGNIDGLVHISEISWEKEGNEAMAEYRKGADLEALVLSVDIDRQRISLGIKQLDNNPLDEFVKVHSKGSVVKVKALDVQSDRVFVALGDRLKSMMKTRDVTLEAGVEDLRQLISTGDELEVKVIDIDFNRGRVQVSMTASEKDDRKAAMKEHKQQVARSKGVTLGDVLKTPSDTSDEAD